MKGGPERLDEAVTRVVGATDVPNLPLCHEVVQRPQCLVYNNVSVLHVHLIEVDHGEPYRWFLVIAITIEVLSFIVPLWWFHREMSKQKRALLKEADELSAEIAEIQRNLVKDQSADAIKSLKERLEEKTARYLVLEQLPVWPIDFKTTRLFSISNVALLVPVVSDYAGLSKPWAALLKGSLEKMGSH